MNLKWEIAHNEKRLLLSVPPCRLYLVGGHRGLVRLESRAGGPSSHRGAGTDPNIASDHIAHSATSRTLATIRHLLLFLKIIYKARKEVSYNTCIKKHNFF